MSKKEKVRVWKETRQRLIDSIVNDKKIPDDLVDALRTDSVLKIMKLFNVTLPRDINPQLTKKLPSKEIAVKKYVSPEDKITPPIKVGKKQINISPLVTGDANNIAITLEKALTPFGTKIGQLRAVKKKELSQEVVDKYGKQLISFMFNLGKITNDFNKATYTALLNDNKELLNIPEVKAVVEKVIKGLSGYKGMRPISLSTETLLSLNEKTRGCFK